MPFSSLSTDGKCNDCEANYYCLGGASAVQIPCPANSASASGASTQSACLCASGYTTCADEPPAWVQSASGWVSVNGQICLLLLLDISIRARYRRFTRAHDAIYRAGEQSPDDWLHNRERHCDSRTSRWWEPSAAKLGSRQGRVYQQHLIPGTKIRHWRRMWCNHADKLWYTKSLLTLRPNAIPLDSSPFDSIRSDNILHNLQHLNSV